MPDNRILVKLRPSATLRAAESRANLRPLRVPAPGAPAEPFGVSGEARWFVAEAPDVAASPWDTAHARLADQLGIAESDIEFAEPDLEHRVFLDDSDTSDTGGAFAAAPQCTNDPQTTEHGRPVGPKDGWHLDRSQLGRARDAVDFSGDKVRIAHFDTGYFAQHVTVPKHLRKDLQRNFVDSDRPSDAADPDNKRLILDNSGHGTGTLGILAGQGSPAAGNFVIGGAPEAEIVPLRIADSVVLLRTSTFASALDYAVDVGCDVGTMSMGGLPTRAWRESVDRAYLSGFCMVAAAGNNSRGLPTRHLVYPARYGRVIAVCGVMADNRPYVRLKGGLEGNFGPDHVMDTAMAAYTPNIPWARFGCADAVRMNGEGTSSATPQVAAAAALWYQQYRDLLPRTWQRVEAVRNALFNGQHAGVDREHLGRCVLAASKSLAIPPRFDLKQTKSDNDSFSFLRVLTGLGISEAPTREQMFNLELMQLWLINPDLQELVPDPDGATPDSVDQKTLSAVMEAVIGDKRASVALRKHLASRFPSVAGSKPRPKVDAPEIVPDVLPACDGDSTPYNPPYRRLRIYAADPSLATRLDTVGINVATLNVPWESLKPGPVGEYIEVVDEDASGRKYAPVNLDDPCLLAQDGWAPSEGNAQFHQQMTYAVAMTTISHFERALGRPVLWRHGAVKGKPHDDSKFTPRLTIRPHALRQANAFYSPTEIALKFGYFEATNDTPGELVPGSRVYACLTHDIVAHETTHAILDGMHRRFSEATNIDTLALHEAFADIVSLFQHFTLRDMLRAEIARTRGDIENSESALGSLAVQFGTATGNRGALRDAIGRMENGTWKRFTPTPADLQRRVTPHARGAVLVAAVFDAYLAIYKTRTADLFRIYTGGTGVLPEGAVHPDLVNRLADEAAKTAEHVLTMCIRALDYVPPVDVTFFEYLRGIITADFDLVPDDRYNYRVAFVEAFRRRGIYALSIDSQEQGTIRTLSVDTLRWRGTEAFPSKPAVRQQYVNSLNGLRKYADASLYFTSRKELFTETRARRELLHKELKKAFEDEPAFAKELGITAGRNFEVHELRRASRVGADGKFVPQLIIALTQTENVPAQGDTPAFKFRSGATLVVDLGKQEVKYRIFKSLESSSRRERTAAFARSVAADPLRALLAAPGGEPFAVLHNLLDSRE